MADSYKECNEPSGHLKYDDEEICSMYVLESTVL
jgi:hypothetical protein